MIDVPIRIRNVRLKVRDAAEGINIDRREIEELIEA